MKIFTEHKSIYNCQKIAFTMAEILISLTIVGVIAAIIIPTIHANIEKKTWAIKRKALYSRMSQAIDMMPKIAGYGDYEGSWSGTNYSSTSVTVTKDTAAMAFVTDGLAKVLTIKNICVNNNFDKCGLMSRIKSFSGTELDFYKKLSDLNVGFAGRVGRPEEMAYANPQKNIDTLAVAFETVNGESIAVFYNPQCVSKDIKYNLGNIDNNKIRNAYHVLPYMCATFIYDLNGKKGPNTVGKDIWFMSVVYSDKRDLVTLNPEKIVQKSGNSNYSDVLNYCVSQNARLPNEEEAILSVYVKNILAGGTLLTNVESNISGYQKYILWFGAIAEKSRTDAWNNYFCIRR